MTQTNALTTLLSRRDTWLGSSRHIDHQTVTTGLKSVDQLLNGGWPKAVLTELLPQCEGIGELALLTPTLRQQTRQRRTLVWLTPPYLPYAPALVRAGLLLQQVLVVHAKNHQEWLWAAEQSIRQGALLIAWPKYQQPGYTELRKLQLACAESDCPQFLFRTPDSITASSPAALRLELQGICSHGQQLRLIVHKLRGHAPGGKLDLPLAGELLPQTSLNQLTANTNYIQSGIGSSSSQVV